MTEGASAPSHNQQLAERLAAKFPGAELKFTSPAQHTDEDVIELRSTSVLEVTRELQRSYPFLMDVCGVDYPERAERLDVVYHFADPENKRRLRMKTRLADGGTLPSVTSVYKSANWFEREAFDMFGVRFDGHPNLRRILCHEDFVGHPLRKDYPADRNQSLTTPIDHTFAKDRERMQMEEEDHLSDRVWINIGPAHPATHGTLRFMAVMSGETIEKCDVEIGYLHRCFEKMCETHDYNQIIPYTDRLNYCSAPINNSAWCRTIEKMLGIEAPPRAQAMRMIIDELARIIDHIVCTSTNALDLGGMTNFWIGFRAREAVYDVFEKLCGARLTVSLTRIGGMGFDIPDGWTKLVEDALKVCEQANQELDLFLTKNRIFVRRMVGAAAIGKEDAINWGFTGPCLRAAGAAIDTRMNEPYFFYKDVEWDVPVGSRGDSYDRYMVRMEEMRQSIRIIRQMLKNIPAGPIKVDDPTISLPSKQDVYGNIEGLMNQFMMVIYGVKPPPGEIYQAHEGGNGELGFYVVSDGSGRPYRVKCRPPCFAVFQAFPGMIEGQMLADAIAGLGSINIIAGELDR